MDLKEVLYSYEHKLLPEWFHEDPKEFIGVVATQPSALYNIISELCARSGQENPFKPGEFSVEPNQVSEDVALLRIRFPKPPAAPLCISSIIIFDKSFEKLAYYTIEKGDEPSGGFPQVCGWEKDGTHINYGSESHDADECMIKCITLYMERFFEGKEA